MKKSALLFSIILGLFSCTENKEMERTRIITKNLQEIDQHSFSKPKEAVITHLKWTADINFENKTIQAIAQYDISKAPNATKIILDTKNLHIEKVWLNENEDTNFELKEKDEILGQALHIRLSKETETISIQYKTPPSAEALQWLNAQQTAGASPFLFTQSQAILCRSWIPIQDSPGIRFTYEAKVKVPQGNLALMSAENPQKIDSTGNYSFKMEQPLPAYLMALAVGDLEYHKTGDETGIYAESTTLDKAIADLEDLQSFLETAEELYGKYRWEQFDVLVLPPSFPFGGMENPRLTFATPTILSGDKSLVSLIAHELAHSWSGNLVTNATWDDFWLNEGFTVYFEYRIMEALYSKDYSEMLASISLKELKEESQELIDNENAEDTHLKLDLKGRNPDVGMAAIAYDKGYFFLRKIEELTGRENFDTFLKQYFNEHAFQSINTEQFLLYMEQNLFAKKGIELPKDLFSNWIYSAGIPDDLPKPNSERFRNVEQSIANWLNTESIDTLKTQDWSTHEFLHFFHQLPDSIGYSEVRAVDEKFNFTNSGNAEVLTEWFLLAIKKDYLPAYKAMENFLINTGRKKFLMPIYGELIKTETGKSIALNIYKKARENYHYVSYISLDKLLNYETD
ncbi:aminopeptidase [Marivirga tractuosa]|uniref:Aminopeptidase N n=1 Tax=Marivirga tractuosa (strain ATCC 23168 / DSM 4126 / NBRC 15989 / NCIMB 1408 / VKM B-1430 / H-43) TaxID=643867 RepID=E4TQA0_MARTH|nr:M1 family metallopeptidase [Marivirga tractuosa]ADR22623.1 Peptidase M1 membrane alanine aminopeptidase [Marivirga tractuosa DSM 4126]BDD16706.1 aminopeptidase [Marivirga tractuosa]